MPKPKVSIILPVYNAAAYIAGAISSVLCQTFTDFELIIINDGSTDNSLEIIRGFTDNRIKVIDNGENRGLQLTLNKGLETAEAEYIARIDADDEWIDAKKLQEQVNFLDQNGDCVLIGTAASVIDGVGREIYKVFLPETDREIREKMLRANQFFHSSVMMRRAALEKVGFYGVSDNLRHVEDYDLWLRLGRIGSLYNLPLVALRYRDISSSVSRQNVIEQLRKNISLVEKYGEAYPGYYSALLRNCLKLLIYGYGRLLLLRKYFFRWKEKEMGRLAARPRISDAQPRILVWESLSHIAGGQRVLLNLLPYWRDDFIVTVIAPSPGPLSQALEKAGVTVKFINPGNYNAGHKDFLDILKYLWSLPLNLIRAFRLIRKNDLIYINSTRVLPAGIIGGLIFRKPVVWHNHSLVGDGKSRALLNVLAKLSCLRKMIAVSSAVARQFPDLADKTEIIYNGVDLRLFKPEQEGDFASFKNIVVVGDLMPTKGQDILIRALSKLEDVDYRLKIIGALRQGLEFYESGLKTLVADLALENRIEFLGWRNDIPELLSRQDLLVLASSVPEACPLAILEALAAGLPVIAPDSGGTREIIKDAYNGYLFKTGAEEDLADKLNRFFSLNSDQISKLQSNCRREAEQKYDLGKNARRISRVIKDSLNEKFNSN